MNKAAVRRFREKQRIRIKRAWDSSVIHGHILKRDRAEDDFLRAKLDRKGSVSFHVTLPDGSKVRVEYSRRGRTDQLDLVEPDGAVSFTGRADMAMREILLRSAAIAAATVKPTSA